MAGERRMDGDRPRCVFWFLIATSGDPPVKLSVVIPVYNERALIPQTLDRVMAAPLPEVDQAASCGV